MKETIELSRVAITGIGVVSPIGSGDEFWSAICQGKSGISLITHFDTTEFAVKIAAEVKNYKPENHFSRKDLRLYDPVSQFAIIAARLAIKDAGLETPLGEKCGVIIGSVAGGAQTYQEEIEKLLVRGPKSISPWLVPRSISSIVSANVAIDLGAKGENFSVASACATGAHAIGNASRYIKFNQDCDSEYRPQIMLAGASEACITPMGIGGFQAMRILSKDNEHPEKAVKPFDKLRNGFAIGEGSCVLVLEDLKYAISRGARIYALLVGYAANCDAENIVAPSKNGEGAAECMKRALRDAEANPEDVGYINAHGCATEIGDIAETRAIKQAFGESAYHILVSSSKSMLGHMLGAAGAIESAITVLAIDHGIIPPTINYQSPDPECDLDYTPNVARKVAGIEYAMSNSFGFGGQNAVFIFQKYNG